MASSRSTPSRALPVPHWPKWHQWIAAGCVFGLVKTLAATLRYRYEDRRGVFETPGKGPAIWDAFQVPLPFARCQVILAAPVRVPRSATDAEREQIRGELQHALQAITRD